MEVARQLEQPAWKLPGGAKVAVSMVVNFEEGAELSAGDGDNVPVSLFLSTARTDMLPIRMWGMMESTLDVRIAAVSGVLIAAAFVLMLIMEWTVGLTRRMRD